MRRIIGLAAVLAAGSASAGEGMWVPGQLPELADTLTAAGMRIDPGQLADLTGHPMGAVVSIGGCTASFVSPRGLVATNHHCAYGAIQLNSSAGQDLLADGFVAATPGDELSAGPNQRVFVTREIRDVTAEVNRALSPRQDGVARQAALESVQKALIADCEAAGGVRCRVFEFFGGLEYRLFTQLEIRDVRLVYAPPGAIGKYGGDVDNWMWPRHTGDFAFYRAYVAPDGSPAAYSAENVPFEPVRHLRVAEAGLAEGDFAMVAGYPGRTFRHALADELEHTIEWTYPTRIAFNRDLLDIIEAAGEADREIEIRYAGFNAGWNNAMKNFTGQLEGFARSDALARKRDGEAEVLAWLRSQGRSGRPALQAHGQLQALHRARRATAERDLVLGSLGGIGLFDAARRLHRLSIEREKPDAERAAGFQSRDEATIEGALRQLDRRMDPGVDRQLMAYLLGRYQALPPQQRVAEIDAWLDGGTLEEQLDGLYADTALVDAEARLAWLERDREAIEASGDSFLQLAVALAPAFDRLELEGRRRSGEEQPLRSAFLAGVIDFNRAQGRAVYPDANGSLRITFGHVMGYSPADAIDYRPFTTLEGLLAKDTGEDPFDSPANQLELIRAGHHGGRAHAPLGSVPVNVLTDMDVTGGNSGSPLLNADGDLVGLVFDMNWESVASNWVFDPPVTRTINVDIRYLLWVMENVFPAPHLLQEMGVRPAR